MTPHKKGAECWYSLLRYRTERICRSKICFSRLSFREIVLPLEALVLKVLQMGDPQVTRVFNPRMIIRSPLNGLVFGFRGPPGDFGQLHIPSLEVELHGITDYQNWGIPRPSDDVTSRN